MISSVIGAEKRRAQALFDCMPHQCCSLEIESEEDELSPYKGLTSAALLPLSRSGHVWPVMLDLHSPQMLHPLCLAVDHPLCNVAYD